MASEAHAPVGGATDGAMPFQHPEFGQVRVVVKEEEPWFVAAEIARILGITWKGRVTLAAIPTSWQGVSKLQTPSGSGGRGGGNQDMLIISEAAVYKLAFRSNKPEADTFTNWVTSEVLPAIRKHGGYLSPAKVEEALLSPDTLIKLATALKEERSAKEKAIAANQQTQTALTQTQAALTETKPKVALVNKVFGKQSLSVYMVARKLILQKSPRRSVKNFR